MKSLKGMSDAQLNSEFGRLFASIESNITALAHIIVEEESRGITRTITRKNGILRWSHEIVKGELHPSVVIAFSGFTTLLRSVKGMPLKEQQRLADDGKTTVAVKSGDQVIEVQKRLIDLSAAEIARVFTGGTTRDFAAQQKSLRTEIVATKKARKAGPTIEVDEVRDQLVVGGIRVSAAKIAKAMTKLGFRVDRKRTRASDDVKRTAATAQELRA